MRVLVTGSREWTDAAGITDALDALLVNYGTLTVVHGACPRGADRIAQGWALSARHASSYGAVTPEPHPAIWRPDGVFDKTAGFRRNAEMVSLGADLCLAFYKRGAGNKGTDHCARLAENAGIPVRRITDRDAILTEALSDQPDTTKENES